MTIKMKIINTAAADADADRTTIVDGPAAAAAAA